MFIKKLNNYKNSIFKSPLKPPWAIPFSSYLTILQEKTQSKVTKNLKGMIVEKITLLTLTIIEIFFGG